MVTVGIARTVTAFTAPAPAPTPHTYHFPSTFPTLHLHDGQGQLASDFATYILSGVTSIGLDLWTVIVPFLIALTVITWLVHRLGMNISVLEDRNQMDQDLTTAYHKAMGHRVGRGLLE